MLQRGGKVVCRAVKSTSKKHLTAPILRTVKRTAKLFTDEWCGYETARQKYTKEQIVDHGKGQYVCGERLHLRQQQDFGADLNVAL